MDADEIGLHLIGFAIDQRAVAFVKDERENRRFLEGIDPHYWAFLAATLGGQLDDADPANRQRTAAALRLAYGQAVETLFALLAAFVQVPQFPFGWMALYRNHELRGVVEKIHNGRPILSPLKRWATWRSLSEAVHAFVPEEVRAEAIASYAELWKRLAEEFLIETFEPEYNTLKHGMRALVGGFAVAFGPERAPGQPAAPEEMRTIGKTEYGSTFWMPPEKVAGYQRTYSLTRTVSRAWVPEQFIIALQLIGLSVQNVVSRALIEAGSDSTKVKFVWLSDRELFRAPWRKMPSITHLSMGHSYDLGGWVEPTADEIRGTYQHQGHQPVDDPEKLPSTE